jgi:hypothetical protein
MLIKIHLPQVIEKMAWINGLKTYIDKKRESIGLEIKYCTGFIPSDESICVSCILETNPEENKDSFRIYRQDNRLKIIAHKPREFFYAFRYLFDDIKLYAKDFLESLDKEVEINSKFLFRLGTPQAGLGYYYQRYEEEQFQYLIDCSCSGILVNFILNNGLNQFGQSSVYPEIYNLQPKLFIDDSELSRIISLAEKYGLETYIAVTEPHFVDPQIKNIYPDIHLTREHWGKHSICLSSVNIARHYKEIIKELFRKQPKFAGIVLFTGDGGAYICNSGDRNDNQDMIATDDCSFCASPLHERRATFVNLINAAISESNPDAKLIFQIWYDSLEIEQTIPLLDKNVIVSARFEEGAEQVIDGEKIGIIKDTEMCVIGPGDFYRKIAQICKSNGINFMAQFPQCSSNIFDLLPTTIAPERIAEKALMLEKTGSSGWLSYEHGMCECPNCALLSEMSWNTSDTAAAACRKVSRARYNENVSHDLIVKSWNLSSRAVSEFPFGANWFVRVLSSMAIVWVPLPGLMKVNGNLEEPLLGKWFSLAKVAENYELYHRQFNRLYDLYRNSLSCFELAHNSDDLSLWLADRNKLICCTSNSQSASNLLNCVKLLMELNQHNLSFNDMSAGYMNIAENELENVKKLCSILNDKDKLYFWWHQEVRCVTRETLVRKMQLLLQFTDKKTYDLWKQGNEEVIKKINFEYKGYLAALCKEPVCEFV